MRLLSIFIICLTLFTFCKTSEEKSSEKEYSDSLVDKNNCIYHRPADDSLIVSFIPLYDSSKNYIQDHPVTNLLLDSLLKYRKIQKLISDSSATIYLLHEKADGEDTCKKAISLNTERIRVDIRPEFDKPYYYLCLSFNYTTKRFYVLNNCNSKDSCSLAEWNKNCW